MSMNINEDLLKSLGLDSVEDSKQDVEREISNLEHMALKSKDVESVDIEEVQPGETSFDQLVNSLSDTAVTISSQSGEDEEYEDEEYTPPNVNVELVKKETKLPDYANTDINDDYARARQVTYGLQDAVLTMVQKAMVLAAATDNPRAYETFNSLVNTCRNMNKDLMDIQKTVKDVTRDATPTQSQPEGGEGEGNQPPETSPGRNTANLLRMLEEADKEINDDMNNAPAPEAIENKED